MIVLVLTLLAAPGAPGTPNPEFCSQGNPRHCAQPLQRGQAAPFEGQLLTVELAVDLGLKADGCDARVALEVDFAKKLAVVDLGLERQLRAVDREAHEKARKLLEDSLATAMEPAPFYDRPAFVAVVSVVLTVGAMSLAVWGAGQLR